MNEKLLNLTDKQCPVDELLKYVKGHKCQDCGKCVYGYEGVTQLELTLSDIVVKRSRATDMAQMSMLCKLMATQSICEEGVELAKTALAVFEQYADEFAAHISKKGC